MGVLCPHSKDGKALASVIGMIVWREATILTAIVERREFPSTTRYIKSDDGGGVADGRSGLSVRMLHESVRQTNLNAGCQASGVTLYADNMMGR